MVNMIASLGLRPILAQGIADGGDFSFPRQGSTIAAKLDWDYYFITWTSLVFFVIIIATMIYFMIRYRRRDEHEVPQKSATHNNTLEMAWSIIPAFLVVYMFWIGFQGYMDMRTMPEDAFKIDVVGQKWRWEFLYDNGKTSVGGEPIDVKGERWKEARTKGEGNLGKFEEAILRGAPEAHVPFDPKRPTKVVLNMTSMDVLHCFSIPAFRNKQDVVPGRYTKLWFEPTAEGTYTVQCMEYCGLQHSEMFAKVVVESPEKFAVWIEEMRDPYKRLKTTDPVVVGEDLYTKRGCVQCHNLDATPKPNGGPGFVGAFGKEVEFNDGTKRLMDENYIHDSILNPQMQVRKGFSGIMPSFQGLLNERDIHAITMFIKFKNGVPVDHKRLPEGKPGEATPGDAKPAEAIPPEAKPAGAK